MPKLNVVLTKDQEALIAALVSLGRYQNASEALQDGLRLVEQRENEGAAKVVTLQRAADVGWRDLEAGRYKDLAQDDLADCIAQLGDRAAKQAAAEG
jgi:antitoxin ParD1/3/4